MLILKNKHILIIAFFVTILLGATLTLFNPLLVHILLNIFWILICTITVLFVLIGILAFIGRKDDAGRLFDLLLKGSLKVIDIVKFFTILLEAIKQIIIMWMTWFIPNLSIVLAVTIYLFVIFIYKIVGSRYDVTLPTIFLTLIVTVAASLLTIPKIVAPLNKPGDARFKLAFSNFKTRFVNSFEIVIFLLFLTIDSTKLFFLPSNLRVPLEAQIGNYDLMVRGFVVTDHFGITFKLIIIGIALELFRKGLKLLVVTRRYYHSNDNPKTQKVDVMQDSLKRAVAESREDIITFAAFTVFVVFVFLFFPRLKLLALITASIVSLIMDIAFPRRMFLDKQEDLLSKIFKRLSAHKR